MIVCAKEVYGLELKPDQLVGLSEEVQAAVWRERLDPICVNKDKRKYEQVSSWFGLYGSVTSNGYLMRLQMEKCEAQQAFLTVENVKEVKCVSRHAAMSI